MIFSTFSNIILIILCLGVLVQTTRMILAFQRFRKSDIGHTVAALDHAAARAGSVLADLKQMLATEAAAHHRSLSSAEALRDELSVMVGVGNSVAERIMEAAAIVAPASHSADAPGMAEKAARQPKKGTAATKSDTGPAKAGAAASKKPARRRQSTQRTSTAKVQHSETAPLSTGIH